MRRLQLIIFFTFPLFLYAGWAEQTLDKMTTKEKVGQLFVISICPPRGDEHLEHLVQFLQKYPVGGVLLKQAHPLEQVPFLNTVQKKSNLPLLTFADAEWGLGMRMKETLSYPRNLTLGAIQDRELLIEMGRQIGRQCQLVGAHINLAPVVDVNTNPDNPVIHRRAFGDHPARVAMQATALFQGMQEAGVLACVKHFPGHGDTAVDSHHDLPLILYPLERLKEVEFLPFSYAIHSGIECVMSAHLLVPAIDTVPCTFSKRLMTDVLQNEMEFDGLIVTDALNMKALTNYYVAGDVGLSAFLAGHHFLLYGSHKDEVVDSIINELVPEAFEAILKANIPEEILNQRVLKILQAKERLGLHENRLVAEREDLMQALHDPSYQTLISRLFEEAVTVYRDEGLPNPKKKTAYIQVGLDEVTPFFSDLLETFDATAFLYGTEFSLDGFDQVIIGLYQQELPADLRKFHATVAVFTTPYALKTCPETGTVIVGYEGVRDAEKVVSRVIKGDLKAKGKLPVSFP